jgi:hypothetical protein
MPCGPCALARPCASCGHTRCPPCLAQHSTPTYGQNFTTVCPSRGSQFHCARCACGVLHPSTPSLLQHCSTPTCSCMQCPFCNLEHAYKSPARPSCLLSAPPCLLSAGKATTAILYSIFAATMDSSAHHPSFLCCMSWSTALP